MIRMLARLILLLICITILRAQVPGGTPFRIERLDPALDDIIAPDAKLEILGDRFALTEGPVWVPATAGQEGYLLFQRQCGERHLQVGAERSPFCLS